MNSSLRVRKGEKVLIIVDREKEKIGEAFFEAALDVGGDAVLAKIATRKKHGQEPPEHLAYMMMESDAIIIVTEYSMTHTKARRNANRAGARIATLPGITEEMMKKGGITANADEIQKRMRKVERRVRGGRAVRITSELGTDLTMSIRGRKWITEDTGLCRRKGETTNLPAGEIFIAPREGTAEGKMIVDGAFYGVVKEPVTVHIKEGYATRIVGAKEAVKEMNKGGRDGRAVGELGIGLNPKAKIIGIPLEDQKVEGAVHVSFGDNFTFGGNIQCGVHVDAIMVSATLEVDGRVIVDKGRLVI